MKNIFEVRRSLSDVLDKLEEATSNDNRCDDLKLGYVVTGCGNIVSAARINENDLRYYLMQDNWFTTYQEALKAVRRKDLITSLMQTNGYYKRGKFIIVYDDVNKTLSVEHMRKDVLCDTMLRWESRKQAQDVIYLFSEEIIHEFFR